jgi:hypothetical protein
MRQDEKRESGFPALALQGKLLPVIRHSGNWITHSGFCVQLIHFDQNA